VLRVLESHFGRDKMPFDMLVGTSIGSLIGAAYGLGISIEELERKAMRFSWPNLVDLGFFTTGLIKGEKLEKIIREIVNGKGFKDMRVPFALTTTDIETGEELTHTSGDLVKLVRASCSWPGIFSAVEYGGRLLVDGGVRNSIPTKAANEMGGTFIIAVNPGFAVKGQKLNNLLKVTIQGIQIMGEELNAYQAKAADIAIKPILRNIDQFDFDRASEIIREGEIAAEKSINKIKRSLMLHW
jgi:NTE family protein